MEPIRPKKKFKCEIFVNIFINIILLRFCHQMIFQFEDQSRLCPGFCYPRIELDHLDVSASPNQLAKDLVTEIDIF